MKKFLSGFIVGAILFGTIGVFAVSYVANPVDFKVLVNGEEFVSDPPALEVEGRTYLPLRAMGEALGVPVNWNEELRQAEVGSMSAEPENASTEAVISNGTQSNDKWKITYLNYKETAQIDEYTKAEDGKTFLLVFFDIENISNESQNLSSIYSEYYVDDYKTVQTQLGIFEDAMPMVAVQVEPGKKVKGYSALQVDPDWKKFDFVYNEDLLKKDNENVMKFTLSK